MNPANEIEMLRRIATGDQPAFRWLVDEYWKRVYGHALTYVKSPVQAQEITQDIFLKLWQQRERLTAIHNFKGYLFILGRNQVISAMRKNLSTISAGELGILEEEFLVPDRQLQWKEANEWILKGIEALPPVRRRVFTMSRQEGLSHEEIAQQLGIAKNTVKQHIVLALNFLRDHMRRYLNVFLLLLLMLPGK